MAAEADRLRLRRIIVDKATLSEWLKEHAKEVPGDMEVFAVRESFDYDNAVEVVVKSEAFQYVPDGTSPVVWRPVIKRCVGCSTN